MVLQWLKFDVSTGDDFVVTFDGTLLDGTKTLSALGIGDVAVLFIERRGNNGFQDQPPLPLTHRRSKTSDAGRVPTTLAQIGLNEADLERRGHSNGHTESLARRTQG